MCFPHDDEAVRERKKKREADEKWKSINMDKTTRLPHQRHRQPAETRENDKNMTEAEFSIKMYDDKKKEERKAFIMEIDEFSLLSVTLPSWFLALSAPRLGFDWIDERVGGSPARRSTDGSETC